MKARTRTLLGASIHDASIPHASGGKTLVSLSGRHANASASLALDEGTLGTHVLFLGGSGSGKTNVLLETARQLQAGLRSGDTMLVFDPKGDYLPLYSKSQDHIVSMDTASSAWNIFKEVVADGWEIDAVAANARELAQTAFAQAIEESLSPFFPKAARDIFADIVAGMTVKGRQDSAFMRDNLYNDRLKLFFSTLTAASLTSFLGALPAELKGSLKYLGDGTNNQALGVLAELQETVQGIFAGNFGGRGGFSARAALRATQVRTVFVEYDIARMASPTYQILIDSFIKQVLSRGHNRQSKTYLVIDELRMLPRLQFLENALSYGRSQGLSVIAATQNIDQLYDVYGENRGNSLAAGFRSLVSFNSESPRTREYVSKALGRTVQSISYEANMGTEIASHEREGFVAEDWDIRALGLGEAIVSLPGHPAFAFGFRRY